MDTKVFGGFRIEDGDVSNDSTKTSQDSKCKQKIHSSLRYYFKRKWSSADIQKKYKKTKSSTNDENKCKHKIIDKMEKLTLDTVLAMQEDYLTISPFSSRSSSPYDSDRSSLWETIEETGEDSK